MTRTILSFELVAHVVSEGGLTDVVNLNAEGDIMLLTIDGFYEALVGGINATELKDIHLEHVGAFLTNISSWTAFGNVSHGSMQKLDVLNIIMALGWGEARRVTEMLKQEEGTGGNAGRALQLISSEAMFGKLRELTGENAEAMENCLQWWFCKWRKARVDAQVLEKAYEGILEGIKLGTVSEPFAMVIIEGLIYDSPEQENPDTKGLKLFSSALEQSDSKYAPYWLLKEGEAELEGEAENELRDVQNSEHLKGLKADSLADAARTSMAKGDHALAHAYATAAAKYGAVMLVA